MANDEHKEEHGSEKHGGGSHGSHGGGHGGGGHAEGEHEGAPEWLISFADMVMLIMGFFVILLAMNMGPKATEAAEGAPSDQASDPAEQMMLDLAIGIREAFNNPVDVNSTNPAEQTLVRRLREKETGRSVDEGPTKTGPQSESIRPTEYSAIGGRIPFDDNSPLISSIARQKIADIAAKVGQLRFIIEVRGHASPSESLRNEERGRKLAYERAMAVGQTLAAQGVPWRQIRLVACGDSDRVIARTYDRDQDRQNQRVEVILTKDVTPGDPYTREVNSGSSNAESSDGEQADAPSEPEAASDDSGHE
jgi:flagellar motor protein MotB